MTGYQVLRRLPLQDERRPTVYVANTGSTATAYTDSEATVPGEQYNYRVKALRGDRKSRMSNLAKVTLPQAEPTDATIKELIQTDANGASIVLTPASGNELKGYTATRAASDDATLSSLELQDANGAAIELIPDFDPATTEYSVSVPNGVESVTLTTEKNHAGGAWQQS